MPALTLLVATAGLAAVAFALLVLHATTRARDEAVAARIAALHRYSLDLEALEQPTEPLILPSVDALRPNLGERRL